MFRNRYINQIHLLQIDGWLEEGFGFLQVYSCLTNHGQRPKLFSQHQQI
jgi:hypothetical protein